MLSPFFWWCFLFSPNLLALNCTRVCLSVCLCVSVCLFVCVFQLAQQEEETENHLASQLEAEENREETLRLVSLLLDDCTGVKSRPC